MKFHSSFLGEKEAQGRRDLFKDTQGKCPRAGGTLVDKGWISQAWKKIIISFNSQASTL